MDPVSCPMCQGAIPGKEIHTTSSCPGCGADLSAQIRERLATELPATAPPPQPTSFSAQAAMFSVLAPSLGIAINLCGRRTLSENPVGMIVIGAVCSLVIAVGFIFGVVVFFAPKGEKSGTMMTAIAGICINGLLISLAIPGILTHQKVAATGNNTPDPPRAGWSYISGR